LIRGGAALPNEINIGLIPEGGFDKPAPMKKIIYMNKKEGFLDF